MVNCPNGHRCPERHSYCGVCGAPLPPAGWQVSATTGASQVQPVTNIGSPQHPEPSNTSWIAPPPRVPTKSLGGPRWAWITLIGVVAVVAVVAVAYTINRFRQDSQWSLFPHTMGCEVDPFQHYSYEPGVITAPLPEFARVQRVALAHVGGQRIQLSIEFAHGTPADRPITLPHPVFGTNSQVRLDYGVNLADLDRHHSGTGRVAIGTNDGSHWKANDPGITIISAAKTSNTFTVVADVAGPLAELTQGEPWTPSVLLGFGGTSPPTPLYNRNEVWSFDAQWCYWDAAASKHSSGSPDPTTTLQASPIPPAPSSTQQAMPKPPTSANAGSTLSDADAHGFVGYQGGRCRDADVAVAMGRTADSLAVICQNSDGKLYYVGFGLHNGLPVVLERVLRYWDDGYTVNNLDYQYTVTPEMLEIDQGQGVLSREQWIEYWPR